MTDHKPRAISELVANPTAFFGAPADVLSDASLAGNTKKAILDAWEEDARRLAVASEEGMTGGEPARLDEVLKAKAELGIEDDRKSTPTKAG
jgi:hypothetical protein